MDLKNYYVVKARTAFHNHQTGEIEFRARIKKFESENLLEARKLAFNFRNEFIYGLLTLGLELSEEEIGWNSQTKEFSNISEREIRKLLNPFLEPQSQYSPYPSFDDHHVNKTVLNREDDLEEEIDWVPPNDTLTWYSHYNNGIWVLFVHNDHELMEELDESEEAQDECEVVIDKLTRYEEPLPSPPLPSNLEIEYQFYKKYKIETKNIETTITFFDDEMYLEGFYITEGETDDEAQFRHVEESKIKFNCLKTPFDWTGYNKINWWELDKAEIQHSEKDALPLPINEAFLKGENHFTEFKPGLINWNNSDRNIEFEVAKTICAFLNSQGGYIFIGVSDKGGKIIGIKFSENSKDKFLREFTRIKARYLPPYLAHGINGDFYTIEGKEVFVISIYPSDEPVFLKIKDESNKIVRKDFYIRSDASSKHLYDIEEIVKYCRKRDKDHL
jgi:hypothetical protein